MIIPYVQQDGAWTLSDQFMEGVFLKMQKHELDQVVFYDGYIYNPEKFVEFAKRPTNILNIHYDDKRGCTGLTWLNDIGINSAFGHFCFFPEVWGSESVIRGKETIEYWFGMSNGEKPILDVILGKVPLWNKRACEFVKKIGFDELGTIDQIKLTNIHEPGMVLFYKAR
jgi:hypothetical protein